MVLAGKHNFAILMGEMVLRFWWVTTTSQFWRVNLILQFWRKIKFYQLAEKLNFTILMWKRDFLVSMQTLIYGIGGKTLFHGLQKHDFRVLVGTHKEKKSIIRFWLKNLILWGLVERFDFLNFDRNSIFRFGRKIDFTSEATNSFLRLGRNQRF